MPGGGNFRASAQALITLPPPSWPFFVLRPCSSPLVSNEHDDHVAVAVLPRVLQPRCQVVERVSVDI